MLMEMVDSGKILKDWGPQHVAKILEIGLNELDNVIVGSPVQPSLIGNITCAVVGALGEIIAPNLKDPLLIWGGHHSTALWDYFLPMIIPGAAVGLKIGNPAFERSPRMGAYTRKPASGAYYRGAPEYREPYAGYAEYEGNPDGGISPGGPVYGARWGPYMGPVSARGTRPGLKVAVGTRPVTRAVPAAVTVGPYAGGLVAPKFTPGPLRPKFQLGS